MSSSVDFNNLQTLRKIIQSEGGISSRLDPNEIEFLEEEGFLIRADYSDADDAGRVECLITLNAIQ